MKKKSMITALVLSVAMIGIGTGSAMADNYAINGTTYTNGNANGGRLNYIEHYTEDEQPQTRQLTGNWRNGENPDKITISDDTLDISGYNGSTVINGNVQSII